MIKQFAKRCCAQQQQSWKRVAPTISTLHVFGSSRMMSTAAKKPIQQVKPQQQQAAPIQKEEATPIEATTTSDDDLVVEIDSMQTLQIMLQKSANQAVIVDCYADWCQPCQVLSPLLERVVRSFNGEAKMFKVNVDNVPDVAAQFNVAELPTLFAIIKGNQIVSTVKGLQQEDNLSKWVGQVIEAQYQGVPKEQRERMRAGQQQQVQPGGTVEQQLVLAKQYASARQHELASQIFSGIINDKGAKDHHTKAYAGLIMCLMGKGDFENADAMTKQLLKEYPTQAATDYEARQAIALVELTKQYGKLEGSTNIEVEQKLKEEVEKDPTNFDARLKFAIANFSHGKAKEAMDDLFTIIKKNPKWNEGAARKTLVLMFDALGPNEALVVQGRKRLSLLLF